MAEFCTKCFAVLNENGQCPVCGHRNTPIAVVEEPVAAPVYVPKFCVKCGGSLNENGLCPVCDAPAPVPVAKFCMDCGGPLDENGQCPVCDAPAPAPAPEPIPAPIPEPVVAPVPEPVVAPIPEPVVAPIPEPVVAPIPEPVVAPIPCFCMNCGNTLDENGQCPVCDAPAPAPAPAPEPIPAPAPEPVVAPIPCFCMNCGNTLDENGQCPVCDAPAPAPAPEPVAAPIPEPVAAPVPCFCMNCGNTLDENGQCPVCDAPAAEDAQAAIAVAMATPAEEKKKEKKNSALSVVITILLSLCLFVTMLASVSIITVRNTVSEDSIYNLTEELDVAQLLQNSGVAQGDNFDELYMRLERDHGVKMDDEKLAELIEESSIPEYISEKAGDFSSDFFRGNAKLVITKEEMVDLVKDNLDLLNDAQIEGFAGGQIQPEDCDKIADWLFNGDELELVSTASLEKTNPTLYQVINICLSWVVLAGLLLFSALIGFVMCRNNLSQAAVGSGVVFILLGGFTALAAAVVAWIPSVWASIAGNNMILSIVGSLLTINGWIFAILFALGVAILVTRAIVKRSLKKKAC